MGKHKISRKTHHILANRKDKTQVTSDLENCSDKAGTFQLLRNEDNEFELWSKNVDVTSEELEGYTTDDERDSVELFRGGMEVDRQTKHGRSALMVAVKKRQKEMVQHLLDSGANVLLEDRFGATALCVAFSQELMEIAEILLRNLNFKDRDLYVKRRVDLLTKPSPTNNHSETAHFYKRVLFRVLYKIKKAMEDGVRLLVKHRIFPTLISCADSNLGDAELLRLVCHLCACLMYGEAGGAAIVLAEVAGQFVEARGPDFCVKVLEEMSEEERWPALLPVHACVECPAGRQWARENCRRISEYSVGFRDALPNLRYWTKDENVFAVILLRRFEKALSLDTLGKNLSLRNTRDVGVSPVRENDATNLNRGKVTSITIPAKKKKISLRRKFRNIKFHAKTQTQHHQDTDQKTKLTLQPDFKLLPSHFKDSRFPILNPRTGYADALKKNLSYHEEDDHMMDVGPDRVLQIPIKDVSQFTRNPLQLIDGDVSYSAVTPRGPKSNQVTFKCPSIYEKSKNVGNGDLLQTLIKVPVIQKSTQLINEKASYSSVITRGQKTYQEMSKSSPTHADTNPGKVFPVEFVNTLRDGYNFWSQIPTLTENPKSNLRFVESQPPSNTQNCNSQSKWSYERYHCNEPNLESLPFSFGHVSSKPYHVWSNVLPNLPIKQSLNRNVHLQSETKFTSEDEENLCRKFNDLALDDKLGSKEQLYDSGPKFEISSKDKSRAKNNAFEYDSEDWSNEPSAHSARDSGDIRRSYSDVTRGDNCCNNGKFMAENFCLDDSKTEILKGCMRYSDVIQMGLRQFDEISNSDDINRNNIQNAQLKKLPFHIKPEEDQTDSFGDNLLTEAYLKRFMCKESKTQFENSNKLSEHIPVIDPPLTDFEMKCLEDICKRQSIQQKGNINFCSPLYGYEKSVMQPKNYNSVSTNTEWKDTEKSTCLANDIYKKKKSNKIPFKAIKQRSVLLNNLAICPIILKLNFEILKKNAPIFQRSAYYEVYSGSCQTEIKTTNCLITLSRDFEKTLSLKNYILPKLKSANTLYAMGTKFNKSSSRNGQEHLNNLKVVSFLNNLLQFATLKTSKSSDCLPKKLQNQIRNQNLEHKRQESKENALIKRRIPVPEANLCNGHNRNKEPQPRYLDTGYVCSFINCQTDSKWYSVLKGLQSCVPLVQHLLPLTEVPKGIQETHLRSIHSKVGKIVFSTKSEHTLREGTFGTYIGVVEDGSPVVVRQLTSSTIFKDITALNLSRRHSLKHKNLATFYDAQINLRDFTMSLIYELCEYSLPQYLKMSRFCKSRNMAPPTFFPKLLIIDLMEGIRYLHEMKVVHGFLKPSNIMVTIDDRLKLTDYHLLNIAPLTWGIKTEDPKLSPIGSSISKYCWRPTELIKAENEAEARASLTAASDIQMCGMLMFHLLSGGLHPFGSTDHTCQQNIRLGTRLMGPHPADTESRDLICEMIKEDPVERPTVDVILRHPYFWDKEKRFKFFLQVGNKVSFYISRPSKVADDFRRSCIEARNWTSKVQHDLLKFISTSANKTFRNEFSELLQFAIALQDNFKSMPPCLKMLVQQPSYYIFLRFPTIFMSIYYVVRCSPLLITQMGLRNFF